MTREEAEKVASLNHPLHASGVIRDTLDEYDRAKAKHADHTLDGPASNDLLRLAALVEETGEVAHLMTYDQRAHTRADLKAELIQVASVALTWASVL